MRPCPYPTIGLLALHARMLHHSHYLFYKFFITRPPAQTLPTSPPSANSSSTQPNSEKSRNSPSPPTEPFPLASSIPSLEEEGAPTVGKASAGRSAAGKAARGIGTTTEGRFAAGKAGVSILMGFAMHAAADAAVEADAEDLRAQLLRGVSKDADAAGAGIAVLAHTGVVVGGVELELEDAVGVLAALAPGAFPPLPELEAGDAAVSILCGVAALIRKFHIFYMNQIHISRSKR